MAKEGLLENLKNETSSMVSNMKDWASRIEEKIHIGTKEDLKSHLDSFGMNLDIGTMPEIQESFTVGKEELRRLWEMLAKKQSRDHEQVFKDFIESSRQVKKVTLEAAKAVKQDIGKDMTSSAEKIIVQGKDAVKAVESGDFSEAKKIAEGVKETIDANGNKIREFAGSIAFEKALEPITKDGFSLENLMKSFWNIFQVIFGMGKFTEVVGKADEVLSKGKEKVKEGAEILDKGKIRAEEIMSHAKDAYAEFKAIKNSPNPTPAKYNEAIKKLRESVVQVKNIEKDLTPEQRKILAEIKNEIPFNPEILSNAKEREEWLDKQLPGAAKRISEEFYYGANLSAEQLTNLRKALSTIHFGQDTIDKIKGRLDNSQDPVAASLSDVSDLLLELTFGNADAFGMLLTVVPWHKFAWNVAKKTVSEGVNTYEYNVSLIFSKIKGVNPEPITFTSDGLVKKIQSLDNDRVAQDLLLMQMYRVNGLFATIAGTLTAGAFAGLMAVTDTSHGVDGIRAFSKTMTKDYAGLANEMEKIEKAFGASAKYNIAQEIRGELDAVRKNWLLLDLAKVSENDAGRAITALKANPLYGELWITEAEILKNQNNLKAFFSQKVMAGGQNMNALSKIPGKFIGSANGIGNELIQHIQEVKKFQYSLIQKDFFSRMKTLGGSLDVMKLPRIADKVLYFKDIDSASNTLRQLAAFGPGFIREMFHAIPTAGLVIGGVDLATQDLSTKEKVMSFGKVAAEVLIPVVGPIMLMTDPATALHVNKKGEIENLGAGMASIGLLTLDGVMLLNAARAGKVGEFFTERIVSVGKTAGNIARMGNVAKQASSRLIHPKWLSESVKVVGKVPRVGKVIAGLMLLWGGAGYAYAKSHEDHEKKLVEEGLWDKNSQDLTPKAQQAFVKMDDSKKKEFLDILSHEFLEKGITLPVTRSHFENGIYSVYAKTPEDAKKWYERISEKSESFTQELTRLGIGLEVIDATTLAQQKKDLEKEVQKVG